MLITIGVLAHNEGGQIGTTLESLFSQSVFTEPTAKEAAYAWEIVVVPNGCTDDTEVVARNFLEAATKKIGSPRTGFRVVSLDRPGKSNAWNELIHHIAAADTSLFVLMDADIVFGNSRTISNCLHRLLTDTSAVVVVDQPIKVFDDQHGSAFTRRLSAMGSAINAGDPPGVCGQFYCARASTLRQIWMPVGLSVEDGFVAAMVTSDYFRGEPDPTRIVRAQDAAHYFEGLSSISGIIKHEVRLVIGTLLNCYLCWDSLLFTTPATGDGAGPTIRELNISKPGWYSRMMNNEIAARGRWVIPRSMVLRRFLSWRGYTWPRRLVRLPVTLAAFVFDLVVFYIANRKMVSGRAVGYW